MSDHDNKDQAKDRSALCDPIILQKLVSHFAKSSGTVVRIDYTPGAAPRTSVDGTVTIPGWIQTQDVPRLLAAVLHESGHVLLDLRDLETLTKRFAKGQTVLINLAANACGDARIDRMRMKEYSGARRLYERLIGLAEQTYPDPQPTKVSEPLRVVQGALIRLHGFDAVSPKAIGHFETHPDHDKIIRILDEAADTIGTLIPCALRLAGLLVRYAPESPKPVGTGTPTGGPPGPVPGSRTGSQRTPVNQPVDQDGAQGETVCHQCGTDVGEEVCGSPCSHCGAPDPDSPEPHIRLKKADEQISERIDQAGEKRDTEGRKQASQDLDLAADHIQRDQGSSRARAAIKRTKLDLVREVGARRQTVKEAIDAIAKAGVFEVSRSAQGFGAGPGCGRSEGSLHPSPATFSGIRNADKRTIKEMSDQILEQAIRNFVNVVTQEDQNSDRDPSNLDGSRLSHCYTDPNSILISEDRVDQSDCVIDVIVDTSGSMLQRGGGGMLGTSKPPLTVALSALRSWIGLVARVGGNKVRLGIVSFSDDAERILEYTAVTDIDPYMIDEQYVKTQGGGTNIELATQLALDALVPEPARKRAVLVITDGAIAESQADTISQGWPNHVALVVLNLGLYGNPKVGDLYPSWRHRAEAEMEVPVALTRALDEAVGI